MREAVKDTYRFDLARLQYTRIRWMGWLFFVGLVVCAVIGALCGAWLWTTYAHDFTFYLKWQDALVALSWFCAFDALGGAVLVARFLYALRQGYTAGMVTFEGKNTLTVRDLSPENMKSIFWLMNGAFWSFVVTLIGLVPAILIGWTMHMSNPVLMVATTGIAVLLSIAGLVVSIAAIAIIVIGLAGGISLGQRLGSYHTYQLNGQASIRIDNFVLTVSYPSNPESMVDLNLLSANDQQKLFDLLHKRWVDAQQVWNPELGAEIAFARQLAERRLMVVA
jgi:hypothetical protein